MGLRNLFLTLSDADKAAVNKALARIDQARFELEEAADALERVPKGFENEHRKIAASVEGLMWERRAVANRLAEIESRAGRKPHDVGVKQG